MKSVAVRWVWVAILLALLGFADASYLASEHLRGAIPPCTVGGCEQVLMSAYATIAGMPVALLGAVYYLATVVLLLIGVSEKKAWAIRLATWIVSVGLLATLYFVGLQLFVLEAICVYCMGSAASTTGLFAILHTLRLKRISL
jgi:uncharacterized membrane protein